MLRQTLKNQKPLIDMQIIKKFFNPGMTIGVIGLLIFSASFLFPDTRSEFYHALANPEAEKDKVIHDSQWSEPTPGNYVVKISDGVRSYDNIHPAMEHVIIEKIDLSQPKWILWLAGPIITVAGIVISANYTIKEYRLKSIQIYSRQPISLK